MSVGHLLFPCCTPATKGEDKKVHNNGGCSSLANQIITSLVLGILVAAAAAAATYYLAYQDVMWTSIAGAGGFLLTGLITYIALRCCYGKSKPITSQAARNQTRAHKSLPPFPSDRPKKIVDEHSTQSQKEGPKGSEKLDFQPSSIQEEEFESFEDRSDTLSSSRAPVLSTTVLCSHLLANLEGTKSLEAQKDPANGLPIPPPAYM